ncbi:benzoate/H(+) symporter BenE family transporter [Corynebacterium glutamicum]|uniref:benzoate/H(+) symporter BenE family transporter n=1 Tax=Corynebacterium TaxID=1716 RepID=UPI000722599E|nr:MULTISPECIES: benzoate/H(+) symporter BenE family transporter [Corynebacterium]ALP50825.1 benzoate transporter [Corynebacterium glutamicum]ANR63252.1 benzoate membrane transport protein [[Brevibacterium] flavum ZL-1]ANR66258.1 benzoate membrane transport protein [Corynebacterium glutamicum ZL-6]ANU34347.1 benzoate transporter [Corynebacterium glutamicum]APT08093.1 benzoate transporter [Corynebacterium glutamicum]
MASSVLLAVEKPELPRPTFAEIKRDLGPQEIGNGLVALIFSASGPIAVILAAAAAGDLSPDQTSSWIFGAFLGNGLLTLWLTYLYRSPQAYFWTIPGTVIVGDSLTHLSFAEVIGAYLVTGVVVFALGWTGLIGRIMAVLPPTIVMAMVAGIFLRFGLDLIDASVTDPLIALPMVIVFVALSMSPRIASIAPPVAVAAVVGTIVAITSGKLAPGILANGIISRPVFTTPEFSFAAIMELVVPLAITVVIVQNGQGVAVLKAAGHRPGVNLAAAASGLWSLPMALIGNITTCLTGPTNALIVAGAKSHRHYTAAMVTAIGAIIVGLFSPTFVGFMLAMPISFIAALAGIAMLTPLKNAFIAGFSGAYSTGALVCFLVTVSEISILGITAPFWGIVFGWLIGWLLDSKLLENKKRA